MKILTIVMRVLFCLVLLLPISGIALAGIIPEPTADMYSPDGWAFMQATMNTYLPYLIALTAAAGIVLTILKRDALAAVIVTPVMVNVFSFHAFVDKSIFSPAAILAWVLIITTLYLLWWNADTYRPMF